MSDYGSWNISGTSITSAAGTSLVWGNSTDTQWYTITDGGNSVQVKAKKYLLFVRGGSAPVESYDTADEALTAAKRLASKNDDEVYIFAPSKTVRPIPKEVEVVDSE